MNFDAPSCRRPNDIHLQEVRLTILRPAADKFMALFTCLKWPEMGTVALQLIAHMHEGHAHAEFSIPVVEFVSIFSPSASVEELAEVAACGDLYFTADSPDGGTFTLAEGNHALFALHREGLVLRIPVRMSGQYELRPGAFRHL